MLPAQLAASQFARYPPAARQVAVDHLELFRQMPLALLPSLLRELIDYDYRFPAERTGIDRQLSVLTGLTPAQRRDWFRSFAAIQVGTAQGAMDWAGRPVEFNEDFSAYLWQTHQMDAFRAAATAYGDRLQASVPAIAPVARRLGIAVIGQGAAVTGEPLFQRLRPFGTLFTHVDPQDGLAQLLAVAEARSRRYPSPFGHWYIDGGTPYPNSNVLTTVSYGQLLPAREALLATIQREVGKAGMGPEALRDHLLHLSSIDLGLRGDPVLDSFQMKVLTEGSGTQIFSTTFVQWTTREALRRAEAVTVLARFAPRQRQRPMNELLSKGDADPEIDPAGSLVDADMAAYYQWINQQRLPGASQSSFLVWFEGQSQALAISPTLPRNTVSGTGISLAKLTALLDAE